MSEAKRKVNEMVGSKEAALRAMREGKQKVSKPIVPAFRRRRRNGEDGVALTSIAKGISEKVRDLAKSGAADDMERRNIVLRLPNILVDRLERERAKRGLRSRNELIVALIHQGTMK